MVEPGRTHDRATLRFRRQAERIGEVVAQRGHDEVRVVGADGFGRAVQGRGADVMGA
jgi:hypothetical protein